MITKVLRFYTSDGLELHGMLFSPSAKTPLGIVHVHGLAGNFYENRFLYSIAEHAIDAGVSFFSFNNRGHDYFSDSMRLVDGRWESQRIGAAFERFHECVADIDAAILTLEREGLSQVVLEGHSTGANKVVYHLAQRNPSSVIGAALISPCDDIGLLEQHAGDDSRARVAEAKALVDAGAPRVLMPDGSFFDYPLSAQTFHDYFQPSSPADVFPYRSPNAEFTSVAALRAPLFFTFGGEGDYVVGPVEDTCKLLSSKAVNSRRVDWVVVPETGHTYSGKEADLASSIVRWIGTLRQFESKP
jgi:pimeloyl-ACP methyl ester carboxylesterase